MIGEKLPCMYGDTVPYWTDGRTDGWTDRQTDRRTENHQMITVTLRPRFAARVNEYDSTMINAWLLVHVVLATIFSLAATHSSVLYLTSAEGFSGTMRD